MAAVELSPTDLLWAYQLKREHQHLLTRIQALESSSITQDLRIRAAEGVPKDLAEQVRSLQDDDKEDKKLKALDEKVEGQVKSVRDEVAGLRGRVSDYVSRTAEEAKRVLNREHAGAKRLEVLEAAIPKLKRSIEGSSEQFGVLDAFIDELQGMVEDVNRAVKKQEAITAGMASRLADVETKLREMQGVTAKLNEEVVSNLVTKFTRANTTNTSHTIVRSGKGWDIFERTPSVQISPDTQPAQPKLSQLTDNQADAASSPQLQTRAKKRKAIALDDISKEATETQAHIPGTSKQCRDSELEDINTVSVHNGRRSRSQAVKALLPASKTNTKLLPNAGSETQSKRGPGRPNKAIAVTKPSSHAFALPQVKRRPGRPKKVTTVLTTIARQQSSAPAPAQAKRGPDRPRKVQLKHAETKVEEATLASEIASKVPAPLSIATKLRSLSPVPAVDAQSQKVVSSPLPLLARGDPLSSPLPAPRQIEVIAGTMSAGKRRVIVQDTSLSEFMRQCEDFDQQVGACFF